jgi:hypothetical protein
MLPKRLELYWRLLWAWSPAARTRVRRSVGSKYAKRTPRKRQQELSV